MDRRPPRAPPNLTMNTGSDLRTVFLAAVSPRMRLALESNDGLAPALADLARAARLARPDWIASFDNEAFIRHIAERFHLGRPDDPSRALAALCLSDLLLAFACIRGNQRAIEEVDRLIMAASARVTHQLKVMPAFVDELAQVLRTSLLVRQKEHSPGIDQYSGRGALENWIMAAAFHAALNLRRASNRAGRMVADQATDSIPLPDALIDPELQWIRDRYRNDFTWAFEKAVHALSVRERNVLRLYFIEGLTVEKIGQIYSQHRSSISRQLATTRERLRCHTRAVLTERLHLDSAELDSLLRLLASQLDCDLSTCLDSIEAIKSSSESAPRSDEAPFRSSRAPSTDR